MKNGKGNYYLNTGNFKSLDFKAELRAFRLFLYNKDKTMARMVLKDWIKQSKLLVIVSEKMNKAYTIEFGKKKGNL